MSSDAQALFTLTPVPLVVAVANAVSVTWSWASSAFTPAHQDESLTANGMVVVVVIDGAAVVIVVAEEIDTRLVVGALEDVVDDAVDVALVAACLSVRSEEHTSELQSQFHL